MLDETEIALAGLVLRCCDWPGDDGGMHIGETEILDTHAEAFSARYARLVVTAIDEHWVEAAVRATTGYATSVIGCDCEAGVDRMLVDERNARRSAGGGAPVLCVHDGEARGRRGESRRAVRVDVSRRPRASTICRMRQKPFRSAIGFATSATGLKSTEQGAGSRERKS